MLFIIAQATPPPEPPPSGWHQTGEAVLRHAESRPDIFWPLLTVAVAVGIPVLLVLAFVRWGIPFLREEAQKNRENLAAALRDRAREALEDSAAARELGRVEKEALVNRIEGKIDRVTGELAKFDLRAERQGELLSRLAAKVGAVTALLCAFLGGAAAGAGWLALLDRPAAVTTAATMTSAPAAPPRVQSCSTAQTDEPAAHDCPKGCPTDSVCCGAEKCCPKKKATAKAPASPPLSSLELASLASFAAVPCLSALDACVVAD